MQHQVQSGQWLCRRSGIHKLLSVSTVVRNMATLDEQVRRPFTITRIYTDKDGESRFGSFQILMEGSGDIGYLSKVIGGSGIQFRYTPSSYSYSWHTAPRRQFIVNLDADLEIEVSTGEKRLLKQGEVFFVEDTTGKGHFSKAVSEKPRHSLFIPVDEDFKVEDL